MKSLRAFWHWVDNEKPAELESEHFRHLSDLADLALDTAGGMVGERIGQPHAYVGRLRDHWPAVRDLSLAICEALEKMHEAVPKAEPSAYRFEGPVVFDEMATFRDVDSGRYEGTLADAKPRSLLGGTYAGTAEDIAALEAWLPAPRASDWQLTGVRISRDSFNQQMRLASNMRAALSGDITLQ
jgi:hypothetical protein